MNEEKKLIRIFDSLLNYYGPGKWWPGETDFEIIVGAVLTQNVTWENASRAVESLKKDGLLDCEKILEAEHEEISSRIKSSRFYNQKTIKLKNFCRYLKERYGGNLEIMFSRKMKELRRELLDIKGIGKETADSILLYAGNKLTFVSDAYTKRFLSRLGIIEESVGYDEIRSFFMKNLPQDLYLYNEYHALIVRHGYTHCKSRPLCHGCPVMDTGDGICCEYAREGV